MSDDVLEEVTSQALDSDPYSGDNTDVSEMLSQFQEEIKDGRDVENPKHYNSDCKGNILTPCIREGLEELERSAESTGVEYAVIGGIATQLRGLADSEDVLVIGDHFGRRQTSDIDILVEEYSDALSIQRKYDDNGKPNLDVVHSHIPGDEEIIANSDFVNFRDIVDGFDFGVYLPTNEDLIYSKVWNPSLEKKSGTRFDLEKHAELSGYVFETDESKLRDVIKYRAPDEGASIEYLMRAGIDI